MTSSVAHESCRASDYDSSWAPPQIMLRSYLLTRDAGFSGSTLIASIFTSFAPYLRCLSTQVDFATLLVALRSYGTYLSFFCLEDSGAPELRQPSS